MLRRGWLETFDPVKFEVSLPPHKTDTILGVYYYLS